MADLAELTLQVNSGDVRDATRDLNALNRASRQSATQTRRTTQSFQRQGQTTRRLNAELQRLLAAYASFIGLRRVVNILADFEAGLVGVGKTTGIAGQQLQELGDELFRLSRVVPATGIQGLLEIARAAGQLGVRGTQNLVEFTETVARLGSATDLAGEQAALMLARILTVTNESIGNVSRLGSVITRLGNEFAATESEIAKSATRIAQAGAAFGITSTQAVGLGAAFRASGVQAELSGGVITRTFRQIDIALAQGGDRAEAFARITGTSVEELRRAFEEDAVGVFQQVIEGLSAIRESGGSVSLALQELGLTASRDAALLLTLSNNSQELARGLATSADEAQKQTALTEESTRANETLRASLVGIGTAFREFINSERDAAQVLKEYVDLLAVAVRILGGVATAQEEANASGQQLAVTIEILVDAFKALLALGLIRFFLALRRSIFGVATALGSSRAAALLTNPWVGVAAAIGFATKAAVDYAEATDKAAEAARRFQAERRRATGFDVEGLRTARAELERATTGPSPIVNEAELRRLKELQEVLKEAAEDLRRFANLGKTTVPVDIARQLLGPDLTTTTLRELTAERVDTILDALFDAFKARGGRTRDQFAQILLDQGFSEFFLRQLTDGGGAASLDLIGLETIQQRIREAFESADAAGRDTAELASEVIGARGETTFRALRDALVRTLGTLVFNLEDVRDEILAAGDTVEDRITELQEASSRPTPATLTDEQATAIQGFKDAIQLRLDLAEATDEVTRARIRAAAEAARLADAENIQGDERSDLIAFAINLAEQIANLTKRREEERRALEATDAFQQRLSALRRENDLIAEGLVLGRDLSREIQIENELRQAAIDLQDADADLRKEYLEDLEKELRLKNALTDEQQRLNEARDREIRQRQEQERAQKRAIEQAEEIENNLLFEITLLGKSAEERDRLRRVQELQTLATEANKEGAEDWAIAIANGEAAVRALNAATDEANNKNRVFLDTFEQLGRRTNEIFEELFGAENLKEISDSLGDAVGSFFVDITEGVDSVGDAINRLIQDVRRVLVQEFIGQPIRNLASSLFQSVFSGLGIGVASAQGNLFNNGRVMAFQQGGVISGPTTFPMANGDTGLMGEAGPEAIVPLFRDSSGDLGIKAAGGGGQTINDNRTINARFVFPGGDANSFRRSKRQITSDLNEISRRT